VPNALAKEGSIRPFANVFGLKKCVEVPGLEEIGGVQRRASHILVFILGGRLGFSICYSKVEVLIKTW